MRKPRPSEIAWGALAVGVSAYEMMCPEGETLSERVWDMQEKPIGRAVTYGMIGVTALHLMGVLPPKIDPFYWAGRLREERS